jgi:hypothetical protein
LLLGALIFLIVLAVAIFVATLAYFGRAQSRQRAEQERPASPEPPQAEGEPAVPPPQQEPALPAALQETPARPGEVMRVIRNERTGQVSIEVEGQQYTHLREIEDPRVGRRVLWAIADLLRFTGGMAANPQAVRSAAQQVAQDERTPAPAQEPLAGPSMSAAGSRYSMVEFFRRGFEPSPATSPSGTSSFIDEIEAILQVHIQRRPTPLPYEVHVTTGPDTRLQIRVGQDVYGSPDEVPDLEVRELIRAAVAEWEGR